MKKWIALTLLSCQLSYLSASEWSQSLSLGVNLARGNTENTQFNTRYDAKKTREKDSLELKAAANFGEDDIKKNTDNYLAEVQYNRTISNQLFWLLKSSYEVDNIANLDYRFQLTPGLGYKVLAEKGNELNVEVGLGYQGEQFKDQESDSSAAYRFAQNWNYTLSSSSSLWQEAEINGDIDEADDFIIKAVIGIQSKVAGDLSLKSYVENRFTNEPALGLKKNDISFNTVLVYSF